MRKIFICLILIVANMPCLADVKLSDYQESTIQPVTQYPEGHITGKCDSQRTKRRAHLFSKSNFNKAKDVEMINRCYDTCDILSQTDPTQAVSCIRECNDQQREQRRDGKEGIQNGINSFTTLGLLLKLL